MSLEIHNNCYNRLVQELTNSLDEIEVQHNIFLKYETLTGLRSLDEIIPKSGKIRDQLYEYIGEQPIRIFVEGILESELYANYEYDIENTSRKLKEYKEYENIKETAERIIYALTTLPWEYCFTLKLVNDYSNIIRNMFEEFNISKDISLRRANEQFKLDYPYKNPNENMFTALLEKNEQWDENSIYLQLKKSGFIRLYGITNTLENITSDIKAFFGVCFASKLLYVKKFYRSNRIRKGILIHKRNNNGWEIITDHQFDYETSSTISDLYLNRLNNKINDENKEHIWILGNLENIKIAFNNREKTEKILLASQWLFDSHCAMNELLSFIQAIVTLEILLGDKKITDIVGLGELLRNRCAYLIGDSSEQRHEILEEFNEIYKIRSKIVHRGKKRLDINEIVLFHKLRWMCERVICKEIDLIQKDKNNKI